MKDLPFLVEKKHNKEKNHTEMKKGEDTVEIGERVSKRSKESKKNRRKQREQQKVVIAKHTTNLEPDAEMTASYHMRLCRTVQRCSYEEC